ncbi:MAG: alkaline phosphatase family protein, partial [Gemmatimonadetes bacterium]|nr:alkaline phosphatase family protein [Gemmatimonadota bacterium]
CCVGDAQERKVLLIGLDGVRVDILDQATTPNLDAMIATGAFSDQAQTRTPTVSGPGWSSMLTGVWPEKHGVRSNNFQGNNYAQFPDFLTRLESVDPTFSTFAVVDWPPLGSEDSGGPLISDMVDRLVLIDGEEMGYDVADALSLEAALNELSDGDPDAAFVYLGYIDIAGHETSSLADEYRESIETADEQVGRLLDAVRHRATFENEEWLVLVATDHGRTDEGGHGGDSAMERTVFILACGPTVEPGRISGAPNIVDVAVTALTHLGVTIDPGWQLDGRVVALKEE